MLVVNGKHRISQKVSMTSPRPLPDTPGYGQLCALGFALDALGDRWTLLVLRDLARADLRFGALQAINPGISPNLLTTRLRSLEGAGLVDRRPAPRSSTGHMYSLAPEARIALQPVLTAMADFGAFLVDRIAPEELDALDMAQVMAEQMALNGNFVIARNTDLRGYFVIDMLVTSTHVSLEPGSFEVHTEPLDATPDATLRFFPPSTLMRLMGRATTVEAAEAADLLQIEGDREASLSLLQLLSFDITRSD